MTELASIYRGILYIPQRRHTSRSLPLTDVFPDIVEGLQPLGGEGLVT